MRSPGKMPFLLAIALLTSACGGKETPVSPPPSTAVNDNSATASSSGGVTNSIPGLGKHFLDVEKFPKNLMISGGVSKDGIPALTRPNFVLPNSEDASYLSESDYGTRGIYERRRKSLSA